jgi:hypothetical protein
MITPRTRKLGVCAGEKGRHSLRTATPDIALFNCNLKPDQAQNMRL